MASVTSTSCAYAGGTGTWSNTGNVGASDDAYVSQAISAVTTETIRLSTFGFAIPTGSTIDGIEVTVEAKGSTTDIQLLETSYRLYKSGAIVGTGPGTNDTDLNVTTSDANYSCGGAADLWGTTLSVSEVNDSTFGVRLSVRNNSGVAARTAYIDYVSMTIYYTPPASSSSGLFFGSNF